MKNDLEILLHGTEQVVPRHELEKKLARGLPLTVKLGADPTAPDLHLGHAVVLTKMKEFQDQGHNIIFLIGDFTARIGDPSGRSKTRPPLSPEQIAKNAQTYFSQVSRILDPQKITIRYNSEWLSNFTLENFIELAGKLTLARIIERDDFAQRIKEHLPIGFHELFYPLMQGYDSVALQADVELGGTDQTFNLLMGRYLQEHYGQEPQVIITMPLLKGLDGVQKMSKSLGNAIGLTEPAQQAYGKLMSISDELMWEYYHLLVGLSPQEIDLIKQELIAGLIHPMDLKKQMAYKILEKFWGKQEAEEAQQAFVELFQKKEWTHAEEINLPKDTESPVKLVDLVKLLKAADSTSEARRLIESGAVKIDEKKITDVKSVIELRQNMHIKIGKHRFYRIVSF